MLKLVYLLLIFCLPTFFFFLKYANRYMKKEQINLTLYLKVRIHMVKIHLSVGQIQKDKK